MSESDIFSVIKFEKRKHEFEDRVNIAEEVTP
jgi:hypothetical protein